MRYAHQLVGLDEVIAKRNGSVDPTKFPNETFELLSIPAFDADRPEIIVGSEIGSTKQVVQNGDVLLSKIVPHIRRAWVVSSTTSHRLIASGEWIVFRDPRFDPDYLRHLLTSDSFHQKFMQTVSGVGGSLLRARPSEVAKIKVELLPRKEQRHIAGILDRVDRLRRKRQESIQLADAFLRAVFIQMFGSRPKTKVLTDYCDFLTGFAFKSDKYTVPDGAVRLLRGINVGIGKFEWSDTASYPLESTAGLDRYSLCVGDVVLAMDRPWISSGLKCAIVDETVAGSMLVKRVARLRPKLLENQTFVFHCLKGHDFKSHCRITETTIPHISPTDFSTFPVVDARDCELELFAKIAENVRRIASKAAVTSELAVRLQMALQHKFIDTKY